MLTIFGKQYLELGSEVTDLTHGFYLGKDQGFLIYDLNGTTRAGIFPAKDTGTPLLVTAKFGGGGQIFYNFALCSLEERWMGTPDSYMQEMKGASAALAEFRRMGMELKPFTIVVTEGEEGFLFECQAENLEHAISQAINTYPDSTSTRQKMYLHSFTYSFQIQSEGGIGALQGDKVREAIVSQLEETQDGELLEFCEWHYTGYPS